MTFRGSRSIAARGAPRATITARSPAPDRSRTTLNALQKLFLLRSCTDSFFANRDAALPALPDQRCSAPCVGRIDEAGYAELVGDAKDFLGGKSTEVQAQARRADGGGGRGAWISSWRRSIATGCAR